MKEAHIDRELVCDCCGEKGAYKIEGKERLSINVCPYCVEYAVETCSAILVRETSA